MKRTRKWAYVQQEAKRLADLGLSADEIAQRLDVNKSTITRWRQKGKLPPTKSKKGRPPAVVVTVRKSPAAWAAAVRAEYLLNETDDQLLMQAEAALALSFDPAAAAHVRLNATRTFQSLVRQLALDGRGAAMKAEQDKPATVDGLSETRPKNPPVPVRSGVDPRLTLVSAK